MIIQYFQYQGHLIAGVIKGNNYWYILARFKIGFQITEELKKHDYLDPPPPSQNGSEGTLLEFDIWLPP